MIHTEVQKEYRKILSEEHKGREIGRLTILQKISHLMGFHNFLNSIDTGECEYRFQGPWDRWITKFTIYKCGDCGRSFKMPAGNFNEMKMEARIYQMTMAAVKKFEKEGKFKESIELLKIK